MPYRYSPEGDSPCELHRYALVSGRERLGLHEPFSAPEHHRLHPAYRDFMKVIPRCARNGLRCPRRLQNAQTFGFPQETLAGIG